MDISYLNFASAGGVTAESVGAAPPTCAPKSVPVLDSNGDWQCTQAGAAEGGFGSTLLLLAVAGAAYWWFELRGKSHTHTAPQTEIEA